MKSRGDEVARRARSLVGTAYRPKGRDADGLDCVGVAAFALALPAAEVPPAYARRTIVPDALNAGLRACGLRPRRDVAPGDLLVFETGLQQLHLGIATGGAFVHADAGLGRVVERPFPAPWPLAGIWRLGRPPKTERASWPLSS